MSQAPTPDQQAALLMKMLQQAGQNEQPKAPTGPTWSAVGEIVNVDTKKSTLSIDNFSKTATKSYPILADKFVTNQVDSGADLLFKLNFSEKIKIESITFFCKPHSSPSNDNNGNNDNNNNSSNNENNDSNENENKNDSNESKDDEEEKPSCPTRLYFAKSSERLSNYFESEIISRNASLDGLSLIKLNSKDLESENGLTVSFTKNRPKLYKGTGLRQNSLIFGITHEPSVLDEDDDDDTDIDMDGEEKYAKQSIYLSGIVIKAAGQDFNKQDFEAQMKTIEKIKKGD